MTLNFRRSHTLQLILGTGAFALCFAVFGSVSAMMPVLKKQAPVQASGPAGINRYWRRGTALVACCLG